MKVGEYIRTPFGIRKIVDITKDEGYKPRVKVLVLDIHLDTGYKFNYEFYTDEKVIKKAKHSFDIIDLIQVGDYVNGEKVCLIDDEYVVDEETITTVFYTNKNYNFALFEEDIKSIVTKEEFERIKYEL